MGAIAMAGAVFYFWRFVSRKAAMWVLGFMAVGVLSYAWRADPSRACDGRTWFCDLIPPESVVVAVPEPVGPPPCPEVEPITSPVFTSAAANAEVHAQIAAGICQEEAIERVHEGWQAAYDPGYGPWWRRLFR